MQNSSDPTLATNVNPHLRNFLANLSLARRPKQVTRLMESLIPKQHKPSLKLQK